MSQSRFNEQETAELVSLTDSIQWSKEHLLRAESLRIQELPLDSYELSIVDAYRSQLRALGEAFERLMDLRLEQSPDADQAGRAVADGYEVLCALQTEMVAIVDDWHKAYRAAGLIEE